MEKKVKIYKKKNPLCNCKVDYSIEDIKAIKKWILTGSFNNCFYSDKNKIDKSKLCLLEKIISIIPEKIEEIVIENKDLIVNKTTVFITLAYLSNGNFSAKKRFKILFDKVIITPLDLYEFINITKKIRGFGQCVQTAIQEWFKHHDVHSLERMVVEYPNGSNWSMRDVLRIFRPKPRDKKENALFKWISTGFLDIEYEKDFPLISAYNTFKTNQTKNLSHLIKEYKFNNRMIPANYERRSIDWELLYSNMTKREALLELPRFLERIISFDNNIIDIIEKKIENVQDISYFEIVSVNSYLPIINSNIVKTNFYDIIKNKLNESSSYFNKFYNVVDRSFNTDKNPFFVNNVTWIKDQQVIDSLDKKQNYRKFVLESRDKTILFWLLKSIDIMPLIRLLDETGDSKKVILLHYENPKNEPVYNLNNSNIYHVYGLNKNTEKIIKLIEKGII